MTISELKNKILSKGWFFQFVSPNPLKKKDFGWKNLEQAEKDYGGFEAYLKKIAESQNLKQLNIACRSKNGSGFTPRGIFLVDTEAVENIGNIGNTEIILPIKPIKPITNFEPAVNHEVKKHEKIEPILNKMGTEDVKTHIENASMKVEIGFIKAENERLKESNKKLDQKNEELFNEVSKLTREVSTSSAKNELDFQKKELELMSKQKSGLNGIVEEVKNMDPKMLGMIISVFQPNNKAVQAMMNEGRSTEGIEDATVLEGTQHENPDTHEFIKNDIIPMLINAKTGEVGMIGGLIEYFIKHPDHLVMTFKKFFPGAIPEKKGTSGTEEEEEDHK